MTKLAILLAAVLALPSFSSAMSADGIVGPPSSKMSDATARAQRLSQDGSVVNQDGHSRFQELSLRGNGYHCADLGGTPVTTQAGLSATTPALTLWNPVGSGVNLVVNTASVGFTTIAATATFMLAVSTGVQSAPVTVTTAFVTNNKIGSASTPLGQCYRVATLANAPFMVRVMGTVGNGVNATSSAEAIGQLIDRVDGELVITPGELITVQTTAAAAVLAAFSWEEVSQ